MQAQRWYFIRTKNPMIFDKANKNILHVIDSLILSRKLKFGQKTELTIFGIRHMFFATKYRFNAFKLTKIYIFKQYSIIGTIHKIKHRWWYSIKLVEKGVVLTLNRWIQKYFWELWFLKINQNRVMLGLNSKNINIESLNE